jgi:subtilisin family serine protease
MHRWSARIAAGRRSRAFRAWAVLAAIPLFVVQLGMPGGVALGSTLGTTAPKVVEAPGKYPLITSPIGAPNARPSAQGAGSLAGGGSGFVEGEVLVRFAAGSKVTAASVRAVDDAAGGVSASALKGVPGLEKITLKKGVSVAQAVDAYRRQPGVLYAQPNYILSPFAVTPNDPRFSTMWGLNNSGQTGGTPDADIDAPEAWALQTGSRDVIVAVVDSGVDYNHPDLHANMWTNAAEANGTPGVDDDGNGYVDDIYGIDTWNGDSDPMDDNGHGTHCSGTIGAVGDNALGVTGVNWNVSIMAVKHAGANGRGSTSAAIEAIEYATAMGADVISCSWGGSGGSNGDALYDAMAASPALFVCAAGNSGQNADATPMYPAAYTLDNIVSVAATDKNDVLADFSNYGVTSVDLAAPGVDILSTVPGTYPNWSQLAYDDCNTGTNWLVYDPTQWILSGYRSVSAPYSLARGPYGNNEQAATIYDRDFDLTGYPACRLEFDYWTDTEPNSDYLCLLVSTDGGANYDYAPLISGYSGGWQHGTVDLSDLAGSSSVRLGFLLQSDSANSTGYEGVYVDNFKVSGAVGAKDYSNSYDGTYSGTSMATPHVAGVAALVKASHPERTALELKASILGNVDHVQGLVGKVKSAGRLNAYAALTGSVAAATAITIRSSASATSIGKTPVLSGAVTPNLMIGTNIVVYVQKPGKSYWTYSSNRTAYALSSGAAAWLYKYTFKKGMAKGVYRFKAAVPQRADFLPSTSPTTVAIRVR